VFLHGDSSAVKYWQGIYFATLPLACLVPNNFGVA
jgi:hypothetical protein